MWFRSELNRKFFSTVQKLVTILDIFLSTSHAVDLDSICKSNPGLVYSELKLDSVSVYLAYPVDCTIQSLLTMTNSCCCSDWHFGFLRSLIVSLELLLTSML